MSSESRSKCPAVGSIFPHHWPLLEGILKIIRLYIYIYIYIKFIIVFVYLMQDSTFEFEKKRDVPVKYDRELWSKTG